MEVWEKKKKLLSEFSLPHIHRSFKASHFTKRKYYFKMQYYKFCNWEVSY